MKTLVRLSSCANSGYEMWAAVSMRRCGLSCFMRSSTCAPSAALFTHFLAHVSCGHEDCSKPGYACCDSCVECVHAFQKEYQTSIRVISTSIFGDSLSM